MVYSYSFALLTTCFFFICPIYGQKNNLVKTNGDAHGYYQLKSQKEPIRFKENKGQVKDQNWNPRTDVLFYSQRDRLQLFLKQNGFHYQLSQVQSWKATESELKIPDKTRIYRIDIQWLGINPYTKVSSFQPCPDIDNHYNVANGMNPALGVKSYRSVKYEQIYKGIDLEFHGKNGYLEYDFMVQPGADYKQIQIQVDGAKIETTKSGELILKTPLGDIHEGALRVFQDNQQIASNWVLKGNVLSFNIPTYDKSKPLIIDPPIRVWGTYYGGTNGEYPQQLIKNGDNLYFCGYTNSNTDIATVGAFDHTYNANNDIMIVAFHKDGYRLWGTYAGDAGDDQALSLCKGENSDFIYVVGTTASTNGIASIGTFQTTKSTGNDGFILKMNTLDGTRNWGSYFGGSGGSDILRRCTFDFANNFLYVTGSTNSSGLATPGAFDNTVSSTDCILSQFNTSGNRNWATYYGGTGIDIAYGICIDNDGNIYIAGRTTGSLGLGSILQIFFGGGTNDGIIAKFNSTGTSRLWGTYYGGAGDDWILGIEYDPVSNRIYFGGRTSSTSSIATLGTYQTSYAGGSYDAFLVRLTKLGSREWGTYFGGTGNETNSDYLNLYFESGYVCIHGSTNSNTGIATIDAYQTSLTGTAYDVYWAKFDANTGSTLNFASYYGGTSNDYCHSIVVENCELYLLGYTESTSSIASDDGYDVTRSGTSDAFLVRFKPEEPNVASLSACVGNTVTFNVAGTAIYEWFKEPVGGSPIHTGSSYITPPLYQTEVYYVEARNYGCISQKRTPVYAYVNNPVSAITPDTYHAICYNDNITLSADARVAVWKEDFNDLTRAQASWVLNEYGRKYLPTSNPIINNFSVPNINRWTINQDFTPYTSSSDGGAYLHITNTGNLTMETNISKGKRNLTAIMKNVIPANLINSSSARLEFEFIGQGGNDSYIRLIYSVNYGAWQEYTTNYYLQNNWAPIQIDLSSLTGWSPGNSLQIGFRFFDDNSSGTYNNPAFGIDNLKVTVIPDSYTWYDGAVPIGSGNNLNQTNLTSSIIYGLQVSACSCNGKVVNRYSVYPAYKPPTTTFSGNVCSGNSATIPVFSTEKVLKVFDFAEGLSHWNIQDGQTLIPSSTPTNASQSNLWVVNTVYNPLSSSVQGGNYLHISSVSQSAMTYNSGTNHFTNQAIILASPLTGLTALNYQLSFDWIGEGANDAYAVLIYKIGSGAWQEHSFIFNNANTWQTFTINLSTLGWSPGQSFNFGFRWRNESTSGNSSFGVDNIQITVLNHPYRWYYTPSGGTPFFTGDTYNTPPLFSNVTYYVESGATGTCPSPRTPITVNVIPLEPVVQEEHLVCNGGTTTINITGPSGATFDWYTVPTGGTKFFTGNSYNTPAIYADTEYYIETINSGCTSSVRKQVNVFVNDNLTPQVDNDNFQFCPGNGFFVTCTFPTTGTIRWYDDLGNLLHTGTSYSEPSVYYPKQIYVESYIPGCPSQRKLVIISPFMDPIPYASDVTICEGQSTTLNATGTWNTANYRWYDAPTGGNLLGTGSSYTTPPLTASTTYYIEGYSIESCTSTYRYAVTVFVNPNFTISGPTIAHQNSVVKYQLSTSLPGCYWSLDNLSAGTIEYSDDDEATIRFNEDFSGSVKITVSDYNFICSAEIDVNIQPTLKLKLKASLQGAKSPLNDGTMTSSLQNINNLKQVYEPTGNISLSPYPFITYVGEGKLKQGIKVPDLSGSNAIDVIQIELRNSYDPNVVEATTYGWILEDGTITDYQCGQSYLYGTVIPYVNFKYALAGDYYIVVKHRNHLPIMSLTPHTINSFVPSSPLDLTDPINLYNPYGNQFFQDINSNAYMFMGNVYDNLSIQDIGEVNATDFFIVSVQNDHNPTGYYIEDLNLDGQVDATDFNFIQTANDHLYHTDVPLSYLDTTW